MYADIDLSNPSWISFKQIVTFHFKDKRGFAIGNAKYRDLGQVLDACEKASPDGKIHCWGCAANYQRRRKQVERFGFHVLTDSFSECEKDYQDCHFMIARQ